ncbi:MAG TPA: DedA family protein [Candidatus Dormibacteraeota bacterium]|nr:DedA family protein [Candidatus Dormibacteraeota bacterium]
MQHLLDVAGSFAYVVVLIGVGVESMGVPVPGETILVLGAVLAGQGKASAAGIALAGWIGAVAGDNIGYLVGRRYGERLTALPVVRRILDPRRAAVAQRFFRRRGWLAVFLGRFVAILRIFAGPLAGMNGMPWRVFVVANAAGGAIWVGIVVTVGVLVGNSAETIVSRAGYAGLGGAVVLAAAAYVFHRRRTTAERAEGARLLAESLEPAPPEPPAARARSGDPDGDGV